MSDYYAIYSCFLCSAAIAGEIVSGPTTGTTDNTAIIILVVIIVLVIVAVILILVVLLILWKFCNDTFNTYICPCLNRGLRNKLHSLEQENQRLRHELNQAKLREPRTLNLAAKGMCNASESRVFTVVDCVI